MTARALLAAALLALAATSAVGGGPVYVGQLAVYQEKSTLEITTTGRKSGEPRSTTIWFVVDDKGRLYVQAGSGGKADWYLNLLKTPAVTVQIAELTMTGVAKPIDDLTEVERVHELFRRKYLRAKLTAWFGGEVGRGKVVQIDQLVQP